MPIDVPLPTPRQPGQSTPDQHAPLRPASSEREAVVSLLKNEQLGTDVYDPEDPEEWHGYYVQGGYHPVQLGDQFSDGRYTIVHKLGHGSYSIVWLAHDETLHRKVAIKIAAGRGRGAASSNESGIWRLLRDNTGHHLGAKVILALLDSFNHQGPNGTHECFVSAPTGLSLDRRRDNFTEYYRLDVARAMAAQLILGVAFLHSKGVVHGDLHTGNVMVALSDDELAEKSVEKIYSTHGLPTRCAIDAYAEQSQHTPKRCPPPPAAPPYIVDNIYVQETLCHPNLCHPNLCLSEGKVLISDFGESWQPTLESRYKLNIPESHCAPEDAVADLLQTPISFPADVWAMGCIIYQLFSLGHVFSPGHIFETHIPDFADVWRQSVDAIGEPPQAWCEALKTPDDDEDDFRQKIKAPRTHDGTPLEERVVGWIGRKRQGAAERCGSDMVDVPTDEELQDLAAMLKLIFRWLPEDRATADELMDGPWMKKWGSPAIDAMECAYAEEKREK